MKKTLTAALALTAFAGIAFADQEKATIDSQFTGCLPFTSTGNSSGQLVCNPFNQMTNGVAKLGDIVGEAGTTISVISENARVLFTIPWSEANQGWCDSGSSVTSNDYPLARGTSVLFEGAAGTKLYFSGSLPANVNVTNNLTAGKYAAVGNVSVDTTTTKTLGDFALIGCDPSKDYVIVKGTKYVYSGGHWYTKDNYMASSFANSADGTEIAICEGIAVVCGTVKRGATRTGLKVELPGSY